MTSTHEATLLLDGALGTALLGRGLAAGGLPETWLAERPEEIRAVHASHVAAGARVVLTATCSLGALPAPEEVARIAVRLAREAGALRVAGAVCPRGDVPRALRALSGAGADLLWAETQWDLAAARGALAAGLATGLPVVVTLAFGAGEPASLPAGGLVADALRTLAAEGAAAVGVNCVEPGETLERLVRSLAPALPVPLVAKPSPGPPGAVLGPAAFAARVRALADAGAAWVGGCCGATAEHLAAIRDALGR